MFFETWYLIHYKLNEVRDGSLTIFEKVFNLLSYIYVKNKGF
jgi:hypothetical protein